MGNLELPNPRANNRFVRADEQTYENFVPTVARPLPSMRCYIIKKNGEQCKNFATYGTGVGDAQGGPTCKKHAPLPVVREKAEKRVQQARLALLGMSGDAAKVIEFLMHNATQENVKLAAARDVLDRAGLKTAVEVNVTVEHTMNPMDAINEKLAIMSGHLKQVEPDTIEDAEIVLDEETEESNE